MRSLNPPVGAALTARLGKGSKTAVTRPGDDVASGACCFIGTFANLSSGTCSLEVAGFGAFVSNRLAGRSIFALRSSLIEVVGS